MRRRPPTRSSWWSVGGRAIGRRKVVGADRMEDPPCRVRRPLAPTEKGRFVAPWIVNEARLSDHCRPVPLRQPGAVLPPSPHRPARRGPSAASSTVNNGESGRRLSTGTLMPLHPLSTGPDRGRQGVQSYGACTNRPPSHRVDLDASVPDGWFHIPVTTSSRSRLDMYFSTHIGTHPGAAPLRLRSGSVNRPSRQDRRLGPRLVDRAVDFSHDVVGGSG